jgi:HEPN domain-containing protein
MPEIDKVLKVVSEWVLKADNDLKTAFYTLEMDDECPTDTVCFHAQQCVEKYLEPLLVLKSIPFPKTHNIEELMVFFPKFQGRNWLTGTRTGCQNMPLSRDTLEIMSLSS